MYIRHEWKIERIVNLNKLSLSFEMMLMMMMTAMNDERQQSVPPSLAYLSLSLSPTYMCQKYFIREFKDTRG
jgi:hypothetical protein